MDDYFKENLQRLFKMIDLDINDQKTTKFYNYMELLLDWNKRVNLTSITEIDDIILKHFVDSLTILKYIKDKNKLIDVGSGAGFPGIPIAIVKNSLHITLLDSLNKRILFLDEVRNLLNLNNIETIHGRVEEFGHNNGREVFDVSVSRAVANLTTLSEYLIPLVKIGGRAICMKGSEIEKELDEAKSAINILGGEIEKIDKFYLPNSDIQRNVVVIRKIRATPKKYPRKPGTPSKDPIK